MDDVAATKPKPRVLVAEDERTISRLIQANLERAGFDVSMAYDGKDALERVLKDGFDLLVLDVMMPYLDGFEVLKLLRKAPETENLPVIVLTVKSQDRDVFEGYHRGADMYLTKPFDPVQLVRCACTLVRDSATSRA